MMYATAARDSQNEESGSESGFVANKDLKQIDQLKKKRTRSNAQNIGLEQLAKDFPSDG